MSETYTDRWLRDFLGAGPKTAAEVLAAARDRDVASEKTIRRSKAKLGVVSYQPGEGGRHAPFHWALPKPPPPRRSGGSLAALKWHGGKMKLNRWIIGLLPRHTHYVEAFAGGLAVLLAKDPAGVSEVACDVDGSLMNLWGVWADEALFPAFCRKLQATPFSRPHFEFAHFSLRGETAAQRLEHAVNYFILVRQCLAGRRDGFTPLTRTRLRGNRNAETNSWWNAVDGLDRVYHRLRNVVLEVGDALQVIPREDKPKTCTYCDPPYLAETRVCPDVYAYEFGRTEHEALLGTIRKCQGAVAISGYRSDLYDHELRTWARYDREVANSAAGGSTKRRMVECLWVNRPRRRSRT